MSQIVHTGILYYGIHAPPNTVSSIPKHVVVLHILVALHPSNMRPVAAVSKPICARRIASSDCNRNDRNNILLCIQSSNLFSNSTIIQGIHTADSTDGVGIGTNRVESPAILAGSSGASWMTEASNTRGMFPTCTRMRRYWH